MAMADKWTVARMLDEMSRYIELNDPNRFKSRAFERAARAIENLDDDLGALVGSGRVTSIAGIGKATSAIITEIVETGQSRYLDELRDQYPPGIFDLLRVQGLGLKKIGELYEKLGIASLDDLEGAAREGKLAKLRGFGAKTQQKILEGVEKARRRESHFLLPTGLEIGEAFRNRLAAIEAIEDAEIVGSVRRRLEIIRNVNLAIATRDVARVEKAIGRLVDQLQAIDERTFKGVARNEIDVWFHLVEPGDFGACVLETTGSRAFLDAFAKNIAKDGFELRDGGLHKNGRRLKIATEDELFSKTGTAYVAPERRESGDDLTRKKPRPLVEAADLRGTFHVHTTFSDGRNSVLEMISAARDRGFEYVGLSDHSKAAYYAGGLTEQGVVEQQQEIAAREVEVAPMRVFRGSEADILPDGAIDYGEPTLDRFEFVVASVHSRFGMPKDEMTDRILKALDDPHVTFLGHLTGRLLLSRDGYSVDFDRIFERAGERGVIIEINGNPHRLDLDWRHIGRAVERGVTFVINPDAHSIAELSHVISGTWVARKAGLGPRQIFNTKSVDEVEEHFAKRKGVGGDAARSRKRTS